jgi:acyl-CoA synthetase (AMP-forming)/AMP-acid ligase II
MLKIGGENVDPMEVEAFLMSLVGINLAAVVSYPDARLSEVGVAFVKREPGHAVTDAEVLALLPGADRQLQDPAARDLRRRLSDDELGQDPEGEASRRGVEAHSARVR